MIRFAMVLAAAGHVLTLRTGALLRPTKIGLKYEKRLVCDQSHTP